MMPSTVTLAIIYIIIGSAGLLALGLYIGGPGRYLGVIASLYLCYWRSQSYVDDSTLAYLLTGTAIAGGLLAGIPAWLAGGRWREASLPIASGVLVVPYLHWGNSFDGIQGLWVGFLFGWAFAFFCIALALLLMSFKPAPADTDRRAMAWGATVATVPIVVLSPVAGNWLHAVESSALLVGAWSWVRWHQSWHALELRLDAWIDRRIYRIAIASSAFGLACPALVAQSMSYSQPRTVHVALLFAHRLLIEFVPAGALLTVTASVISLVFKSTTSTKLRAKMLGPAVLAPVVWRVAAQNTPCTFVTVAAITAVFWWAIVACITLIGPQSVAGSHTGWA